MKLSISNIAWTTENDEIVYQYMEQYGFTGLEIAPTRWISERPYEQIDKAVEIANFIEEKYGFTVPSMQSIWFGKQELIFGSKTDHQELLDYTKKAIDYAAAIGCKNLVFGCPRNRSIKEEWNLSAEQVDGIAISFFKKLGDYAYSKGTAVGMEANPTIYNTNFINTTEEALDLIRKVDSKGFLLNLDVGTMVQNGENVEILVGKVSKINHVHISEPGLKLIEHRELHKKLIDILKNENYDKFVSIEMGKQEDITLLQDAMRYVFNVMN